MLVPENRLGVGDRRQRPGPRTRRANVGVDVHVDETRLAEPDRVLERALEVLRLRYGQALDAGGARPGGEVRVVGLALGPRIERGAVLAPAEVGVLQVADRGPGEVV